MIGTSSCSAVFWASLVALTWSVASSWVVLRSDGEPIVSRFSSTYCRMAPLKEDAAETINNRVVVQAAAASGLSDTELPVVLQATHKAFLQINSMAEEDEGWANAHLEFRYDIGSIQLIEESGAEVVGATGRVLLLESYEELDESTVELVQFVISENLDQLLYSDEEETLSQPILISILPEMTDVNVSQEETRRKQLLPSIIQEQVGIYEMATPLPRSLGNNVLQEGALIPTVHVELDGAYVSDHSSQEQVWDTSSVLVFDDLISDDLRKRLLDVTLGRSNCNNENLWDDSTNGPDPERWVRGGLVDVPENDENGQEESNDSISTSWGLSDEGIEEICFEHHDAIEEFETILSQLFPQFLVTRLPEAVFGATVSPLTANAPTAKDRFDYHIDGDPNLTPPSPWTDVYGRYPNRIRGKPRFMSCLLYLNDNWEEDWGAPTRFLDIPTDLSYDVTPKPGRCVLMDQDCSHTVVAPNASAGQRPRYSLVWKLILHPRVALQDMTNLSGGSREWPEPILFGSANQNM